MFKIIRMALTCGVTAAAVVAVSGVKLQDTGSTMPSPPPTQQLKIPVLPALPPGVKIVVPERSPLVVPYNTVRSESAALTPIPTKIPKCYLGANYYKGVGEGKVTDLNGTTIPGQSPSVVRIFGQIAAIQRSSGYAATTHIVTAPLALTTAVGSLPWAASRFDLGGSTTQGH